MLFSQLAVLLLGIPLLFAGCAHTSPDAKALPWWVAAPSAPLPKGFPPPGPLDEIIIKQYPPSRAAVARAAKEGESANRMFYPLFDHIEKNHIAMSSPVDIGYAPTTAPGAKPRSMAFIYGEQTWGSLGSDGTVQVQDAPAVTVVSIGVAGAYTDARFAKAYGLLSAWLESHAAEYVADGDPRYLAYNGPFVLPFARYGEVQVPIRPAKQGKGN